MSSIARLIATPVSRLLVAFGIVLGLASIVGVAKADAATEPKSIRIAYFAGFGNLPLKVAADRGYFKANDLNAKLTIITDPVAAMAALGKQFDVSQAAPALQMTAASRGLRTVGIANMVNATPKHLQLVLIAKTPITDYRQLKGKRVGVIATSGGTFQALDYLLQKKAGIKATTDITAIQTAPPLMAGLVRAGRLDAAVTATPFFTGLGDLWVSKTDIIQQAVELQTNGSQKETPAALMVSEANWATKNGAAIRAYRKAVYQAMRWILRNQEAARTRLANWLKLPPAIANAAPLPGYSINISTRQMKPWVTITSRIGGVKGIPPVDELLWPGSDKTPK